MNELSMIITPRISKDRKTLRCRCGALVAYLCNYNGPGVELPFGFSLMPNGRCEKSNWPMRRLTKKDWNHLMEEELAWLKKGYFELAKNKQDAFRTFNNKETVHVSVTRKISDLKTDPITLICAECKGVVKITDEIFRVS